MRRTPKPRRSRPIALAARTALRGRRSTAEVGPYRMHSLEFGEGAETVVLLHGLSGSGRWWRRNLPSFARRYRVVVPDVVGFGRTRYSGPLPDIPGLAEIMAEWVDRVVGGAAHLVGHSMGGQLAIHLAARHPELTRRLVLADAAGIPRRMRTRDLIRFALDLAPPKRWGDPVFLPVIVGDALHAGPLTILRALRHIMRDDVTPLLPLIQAPTLILWGEEDTLVAPSAGRTMRRLIPDARLVTISDAAHNPMVDQPGPFNRAVLRFLRGEEVGE